LATEINMARNRHDDKNDVYRIIATVFNAAVRFSFDHGNLITVTVKRHLQ